MAGEQNEGGTNNQSSSNSQSKPAANAAAAGSSAASSQTPTEVTRPEALADPKFDRFWDAKEGVKFKDLAGELDNLSAFKAEQDLRRAGVPEKPDLYKVALPQTFELPKGADGKTIQFQIDESDPRLAPVREYAHKRGLDQEGFSELLAIQAQYDIGENQRIDEARKGEVAKLGANGPARIDMVETWLVSKLGDKAGKALMNRLMLADDIAAMEKLVRLQSTNGGSEFNQRGREPPPPPDVPREKRIYPNMN